MNRKVIEGWGSEINIGINNLINEKIKVKRQKVKQSTCESQPWKPDRPAI